MKNHIKNSVKKGVKSNQIAVTTFITSIFAFGLAYIDPSNPLASFLIENQTIIISFLSTVCLGLITLIKK